MFTLGFAVSLVDNVMNAYFLGKVDCFHRGYTKCENCFSIMVANRKITPVDDVHSNKKVNFLFTNFRFANFNSINVYTI